MPLIAVSANPQAVGQIALAILLAVAGLVLLLPRPLGRSVAGGTAALLAAAAVMGAWAHQTFGEPGSNWVERLLFILFSSGAIGFGTVLVVQKNPARGAIAFAFVILSTCGLFLLLAAPFLMAATVIIYAGAIIVTFLFVLMLSHVGGPSDENDRSREPLLGSLAGFGFVGLILFAIHQSSTAEPRGLPGPVVTPEERATLLEMADHVAALQAALGEPNPSADAVDELEREWYSRMLPVVGVSRESRRHPWSRGKPDPAGSIWMRLQLRLSVPPPADPGQPREPRAEDLTGNPQAVAVATRVLRIRKLAETVFERTDTLLTETNPNPAPAREALGELQAELRLLAGSGELPARNVANLGFLLYTEHLLAVELVGVLLLVATIGAIAIAQRKGAPQ